VSGKGKVKPNNQAAPGPIGNTQGLIVPQTQPNASGPGNSAPPPKPTPKEEGWWNRWGSDALHTTLDVVGLIPGVGEAADGANALVYLAEGDKVSAALSAAAMLPIGGQAATAAKMAKKGAQALEKQAAKKAAEEAVEHSAKEAAEKAAKEKLEREAAEKANRLEGGRIEGGVSKPRGGGWDSAPNTKRWVEEGGQVTKHADGSMTFTRKDGVSVTYDKAGYPDFSPHAERSVNIESMKGDHYHDFKAANKKIGLSGSKPPEGYTWHHHQDGKTMQLLPQSIHNVAEGGFAHAGGVSIIAK